MVLTQKRSFLSPKKPIFDKNNLLLAPESFHWSQKQPFVAKIGLYYSIFPPKSIYWPKMSIFDLEQHSLASIRAYYCQKRPFLGILTKKTQFWPEMAIFWSRKVVVGLKKGLFQPNQAFLGCFWAFLGQNIYIYRNQRMKLIKLGHKKQF